MKLLLVLLLPLELHARVRSFGPRGHLIDPKEHAGKVNAVAQNETLAFEHHLTEGIEAGMVTYFWIESGPGTPRSRYIGDNLIIRYYIDGEYEASLVFTPSMMAGSGVGLEGAGYYNTNETDQSKNCSSPEHPGISICGMDLLDGWPWETRWVGKAGAETSWISHIRVPFSKSFRMTVQIACGAPECAGFGIPEDMARDDIGANVSQASNFIIRGLEGSGSQLGVELGLGALRLPPPSNGGGSTSWSKFRLHLQRRVSNPAADEFVHLANYSGDPGLDGVVLMMTVNFAGIGMKGPLSVEGCWWALDSPTSRLHPGQNSSDRTGAQLLGTGVEDLLGSSYGFTWWTKTFHNDHAGLSHIHGGPNSQASGVYKARFSLYRFFDKDPLTFEDGQFQLVWRNAIHAPKCRLLEEDRAGSRHTSRGGATGISSHPGDQRRSGTVTSYVWFYTYANEIGSSI